MPKTELEVNRQIVRHLTPDSNIEKRMPFQDEALNILPQKAIDEILRRMNFGIASEKKGDGSMLWSPGFTGPVEKVVEAAQDDATATEAEIGEWSVGKSVRGRDGGRTVG